MAEAEALKAQGNEVYLAGKLKEALGLYSKAVAADPASPVYRSNRSACLYEMARYAECAKDVDACLELLQQSGGGDGGGDAGKTQALWGKLRRRRALCALYMLGGRGAEEKEDEPVGGGSSSEWYAEVLRLVEGALEDGGGGGDKKLIELADWAKARARAGSLGDTQQPGPVPLFRFRLWTGLEEFFPHGNYDPFSGLSGEMEMVPSANGNTQVNEKPGTGIDLRVLAADANQAKEGLAFFYGGVGDGRHVYATLRDIQLQCTGLRGAFGASPSRPGGGGGGSGGGKKKGKKGRSSPTTLSSPPPPPRVMMVMNDIKPHAVVQAVVMFAAIAELAEAMEARGCRADSIEALDKTALVEEEEDPTLLRLGGRVLSLFAAPLLLPDDAAWVKTLMERVVASKAAEEVRTCVFVGCWMCILHVEWADHHRLPTYKTRSSRGSTRTPTRGRRCGRPSGTGCSTWPRCRRPACRSGTTRAAATVS